MRKIKEKSEDGLDQKEEGKVKSGYSILMKAVNEAAAVDQKSPADSQRSLGLKGAAGSKFGRKPLNPKASMQSTFSEQTDLFKKKSGATKKNQKNKEADKG